MPLILVLGHEKCGAVAATVEAVESGKMPGPHVNALVRAIEPAVTEVLGKGGDVLAHAVRANVVRTVAQLRISRPVLAELVHAGRLRIAGGIYHLASGEWAALRAATAA